VEHHIVAEIEGISPAVIADLLAPGDIRRRLQVITKTNQTAKQLDYIFVGGGVTGDGGVKGIGVNAVEVENRCLFGGRGRGRLRLPLWQAASRKQAGQ